MGTMSKVQRAQWANCNGHNGQSAISAMGKVQWAQWAKCNAVTQFVNSACVTSGLARSVLCHHSQSSACVKMHTSDECTQGVPQRDFLVKVGQKVDLLAVVTPLIHVSLLVRFTLQTPMMMTTVSLFHPGHEVSPLLIFFPRGCSGVNLHERPHLLFRRQGENTKAPTKGDIKWRACPRDHVHHDMTRLRKPSKEVSTVHFNRAVLNTKMKWHACVNPANKPRHCIPTERM